MKLGGEHAEAWGGDRGHVRENGMSGAWQWGAQCLWGAMSPLPGPPHVPR